MLRRRAEGNPWPWRSKVLGAGPGRDMAVVGQVWMCIARRSRSSVPNVMVGLEGHFLATLLQYVGWVVAGRGEVRRGV